MTSNTTEIEFGDISSASDARKRYSQYLADSDTGRSKTVRFASDAPDEVVERASIHAGDSRAGQAEQYGQADLSKSEKKRLKKKYGKFSDDGGAGNYMKVRSAKAIALGKGVSNWEDYYDPKLSVDEHREVFEDAEGDLADVGREHDSAVEMDRRAREQGMSALKRQTEDALERARSDPSNDDAINFVVEEGRSTMLDLEMDMHSTEGGAVGELRGQDAEVMERVHEMRSEAAQRADEAKQADLTRNPLEWARAPNRHDLPGVDTVDPNRLDEQRGDGDMTIADSTGEDLFEDGADRPSDIGIGGADRSMDDYADDTDPLSGGGKEDPDPLI